MDRIGTRDVSPRSPVVLRSDMLLGLLTAVNRASLEQISH